MSPTIHGMGERIEMSGHASIQTFIVDLPTIRPHVLAMATIFLAWQTYELVSSTQSIMREDYAWRRQQYSVELLQRVFDSVEATRRRAALHWTFRDATNAFSELDEKDCEALVDATPRSPVPTLQKPAPTGLSMFAIQSDVVAEYNAIELVAVAYLQNTVNRATIESQLKRLLVGRHEKFGKCFAVWRTKRKASALWSCTVRLVELFEGRRKFFSEPESACGVELVDWPRDRPRPQPPANR